ncbi:MAG: aminotransferase class V-fold PLP-dependent enzyme, partial [Calditrichaeota bacterium]|nr:aminotransferase class V-fold PLP-dependent enzyme [Calditrichota bacterium]
GIVTPYHEMAEIMHEFGGYCFVDFSASAPYVPINMHPEKETQTLDAIFFSPHKFLGGPGSSGVIIFHKSLYKNTVPDHPGGGTVLWTNPWGEHHFFEDIEVREDGGTPGFLQGIKGALSIRLKDEMGVANILEREHELTNRLMDHLERIPGIAILEREQRNRVGFVSMYVQGLHHNLMVRLLNDRFGIQTRGGCSCAGTYGHVLLNIDYHESQRITQKIDLGDLSEKPGWVRISLHPTMTESEVDTIADAVSEVVKNYKNWDYDYKFNCKTGDFEPGNRKPFIINLSETIMA